MIFEVLADYELAQYGYHSRTKAADWNRPRTSTPQTCPILTRINGNKKTIKLPLNWQKFLKDINSPSAYKYICIQAQGWFNQPFPKCETLAMGSGRDAEQKNYVSGTLVNENFIKINTFKTTDSPPSPLTARFNYPHLVHRFNIINNKDKVYNGRPGGVFIFLISDVDMFISTARVRPV